MCGGVWCCVVLCGARKIKEVLAEREPLRQAILDFGRHREKTYEWMCAHDKQYCKWVVEEGATASPTDEIRVARRTSPRVTSPELADLVKRVEHLPDIQIWLRSETWDQASFCPHVSCSEDEQCKSRETLEGLADA